MRFYDTLAQSFDAIKTNGFRAGVTIFIIALGITSLVGVLTAIDGIKQGMSESFTSLGANTLRVRNWDAKTQNQRRGERRESYPPIDYREYQAFKTEFSDKAIVGVTQNQGSIFTATYGEQKTNNNIALRGVDESFPKISKFEIFEGRHINVEDVGLARNVIAIGSDVNKRLFPNTTGIGKIITVGQNKYKVIGVYKSLGASSMNEGDRFVNIPVSTLRNHFQNVGSFNINVFVEDPAQIDYYESEIIGAFRRVRGLKVTEKENFSVTKSDAFVAQIMQNLSVLTVSAQVIALITLLGASVALLNVMLVSVTERTSEIGLRKAMGATSQSIRTQFLGEAVVICQFGGLIGIVLGLGLGNLLSVLLLKSTFVVPWLWILVGILACFFVGMASGYYPAWKASKVDPIISLRYE